MPIKKAAKKAIRQTKKRTKRNNIVREKIKNFTKKVRELVKENKIAEAEKALNQAYKILDKATKKNIIKKNTASRKKSRLKRSVNLAKASPKKKAKTKK